MLILEGIPLFLIELGIGQKMRLGSLGVWNTIHPWLGGIGISSCIVTLFVTLYYNVVITWCFFYLLNSFRVMYLISLWIWTLFSLFPSLLHFEPRNKKSVTKESNIVPVPLVRSYLKRAFCHSIIFSPIFFFRHPVWCESVFFLMSK